MLFCDELGSNKGSFRAPQTSHAQLAWAVEKEVPLLIVRVIVEPLFSCVAVFVLRLFALNIIAVCTLSAALPPERSQLCALPLNSLRPVDSLAASGILKLDGDADCNVWYVGGPYVISNSHCMGRFTGFNGKCQHSASCLTKRNRSATQQAIRGYVSVAFPLARNKSDIPCNRIVSASPADPAEGTDHVLLHCPGVERTGVKAMPLALRQPEVGEPVKLAAFDPRNNRSRIRVSSGEVRLLENDPSFHATMPSVEGNSGAIMLDRGGNAIGLLWGGVEKHERTRISSKGRKISELVPTGLPTAFHSIANILEGVKRDSPSAYREILQHSEVCSSLREPPLPIPTEIFQPSPRFEGRR